MFQWLINMFKGGFGAMTFNYSAGTATASNGWSYSIKAAFDSQLAAQPQYRGLTQTYLTSGTPEGSYHVANMAIGVADNDYRAKYGVMPGGNLSEFGQWVSGSRQSIWNDAVGWFLAVPYTPSGSGGGDSSSGGSGGGGGTPPSGSAPDAGFFSSIPTLGIIAAVALVALLLVKR